MFNYTVLPGSNGLPISEDNSKLKEVFYTALESQDEKIIYEELNESLTALETDTAIYKEDLATIEEAATGLTVSIEFKEEIQLRIDWMKCLYEAQRSLSSVKTLKEAESLRSLIAPVQTCPLKAQVSARLEQLVASLPARAELIEQSDFDQVMEKAIEQAGEEFINLGAAGRKQVVEEQLKRQGSNVAVEAIVKASSELESQVTELDSAVSEEDMKAKLDALPLPAFAHLLEERKVLIAARLLEKGNWQGLASLDRMIHQLDCSLNADNNAALEELDSLHSKTGSTATSLDISKLDSDLIKFS